MLQKGRLAECNKSDVRHIVPHFPVPGKERTGLPRIIGNFMALDEVTTKLKPMYTVDPLTITKHSAHFLYRGKIDLSKAFFQMQIYQLTFHIPLQNQLSKWPCVSHECSCRQFFFVSITLSANPCCPKY